MSLTDKQTRERIRELNDAFRKPCKRNRVLISSVSTVRILPSAVRRNSCDATRTFSSPLSRTCGHSVRSNVSSLL